MTKKFGRPKVEKTPRAEGRRPPIQVTFMEDGILIESGNGFRFVSFGGLKIVRPRYFREVANRTKAEAHLRKKYAVGTYRKAEEINEILNYQVAFFEGEADRALRRLASHDCLHFLFDQYDRTKEIENLIKAGKLPQREADDWTNGCSYTRRAFKFLCERIVLLNPQPDGVAQVSELTELYEEAIICAEQLVKMSMCSDQTRYLFPDKSVYTLFPEGDEIYWDLAIDDAELTEAMTKDLQARISADAKVRDNHFSGVAFDQDWQKHDEIIGEAFEKMAGMRYEKALRTLSILPVMCKPGDLGACSIPKERLIQSAAINMETEPELVRKVFSGFWLTAENMATEARNFWNPKNTYRAYRRGMFEIGEESDRHLTWSDSMYKECWFMFMVSIAYGILPPEWDHSELKTAIGRLKVQCGRWFENVVKDQVKLLGLQAICSRTGFGQGKLRVECPYGEIDLIAYSEAERLLIVGESKMIMGGSEARFFRDDLEDFVRKDKCYANKFRKKIEWVMQNLQPLSQALDSGKEFSCAVQPLQVAPVMVTYTPSPASYFIPDFPCVALSELVSEYSKNNTWPYARRSPQP